MSDSLVSPSRTVTIAGKAYRLDGSFGTLRAVQEHFDEDIVQILIRVMDMRMDEIADLIAIGAGQIKEADTIGQAIADEIGMTRGYALLKTELTAWLNVAIAPKAEREKKRAEAQAIIDGMKNSASHGPITSGSPSALSAGSPANSGEATSGS